MQRRNSVTPHGLLLVSGEVDIKGNTSYTCHWKYSQNGADGPIDAGTVVPLQRDGNYSGVNAAEARDHFTSEYSGLSASYGPGEFCC